MANILNSLSRVKQGDVVLSVRDIKKTFIEGGQPLHILRGGGFDLHRGEIIALVGQSGCGKSTIVELMLRLYNIDNDKILIDGYDIMNMPLKLVRDIIAYVPQETFLFNGTIYDNIRYGNDKMHYLLLHFQLSLRLLLLLPVLF